MNETQLHSVAIAAVFAITGFGLFVYKTLRPEHRPESLQLAISRCLLCAVAYATNGLIMGFDVGSLRLQALVAAPINFALIVAVAAICTMQARSYGTVDVSPRARQLLRHTAYVFMLCFAANLAMSMIWPVPVLERFSLVSPHYLLNRAFVTLAETVFLAIAAFVSFQAAGPEEPVGRIRLQNASFCVCYALIVCICINAYAVVCFRVFVADDSLRKSLIDASLTRESWLAASAGALYVIGFALYYTNDGRTRAITRFSKWRRVRRELDQKLWSIENEEFGKRFLAYESLPKAAWELVERASRECDEGGFRPADVPKTLDTFKLFAVVAESDSRFPCVKDAAFASVLRYQESMLREPATARMRWSIAPTSDRDLAYDLATDPIPEAIKKLREFLKDPCEPRLVGEPQWFQLAAFAAADAGILPPHKAHLLHRPGPVMDRVARAYRNALLLKTF